MHGIVMQKFLQIFLRQLLQCLVYVMVQHNFNAYEFFSKVSRLTLNETVLQLSRGGAGNNGPAPPIDKLGIKPYNWNTECLRGYGLSGEATCFPQPIGLAATFK